MCHHVKFPKIKLGQLKRVEKQRWISFRQQKSPLFKEAVRVGYAVHGAWSAAWHFILCVRKQNIIKFKSSESTDLNYRWFVFTCNSLIIIINELQIRKRKNISSWVIACKFSDGGMLQCLCQSLWSATILWRHKLVPRSDPRLQCWCCEPTINITQWTFAQPG